VSTCLIQYRVNVRKQARKKCQSELTAGSSFCVRLTFLQHVRTVLDPLSPVLSRPVPWKQNR
jgi:hypothetical protein